MNNASSSIIQTLISTLFLLVLYRYLLEHLGSEQLGLWSVLLASISVTRLSDMGLGGTIVKFVARYRTFKDDFQAAEIIHTATISVAFSMGFFCFLIYLLLDKFLILFIPKTSFFLVSKILPWVLISFWLGSIANIFQSALDGCQRIDVRNIIMVLANTIFLITGIFGVFKIGIVGLAFAQLLQSSFLLIFNWLAIRKYIVRLRATPFLWNKNKFKEMFSYAVNFQINSIAILLFDPVSKLLMSRYGGLSSVGYYEMASQMVLKLRALLVSALQPLVPAVAELHEISTKKIRNLYFNFYKILFFVNLILYVSMFIFLPFISFLWLGYFEIKFLFFACFLIIAWGINSLTIPAYFFNLGTGDLRWNTISHVLMGVLNILFCIVLGPRFGDTGVVIATIFSLIICSILNLLALLKRYEIPFKTIIPTEHYKLLFVMFCFIAISMFFSPILKLTHASILLNIVNAIIFLAFILITIWFHPYRLEMKSLLRRWCNN